MHKKVKADWNILMEKNQRFQVMKMSVKKLAL